MPHRLDRPASGAIVFAKDPRTTRKLGEQFEKRRVHKVYWACVEGRIDVETGRWEDSIYKVAGEPRAEIVGVGHPEGRHAALHYRVLRHFDWGSWLEIEWKPAARIKFAAGRLPRPSRAGRQTIWLDRGLWTAIRG